jgi:sugar lactone lactonase YvrE
MVEGLTVGPDGLVYSATFNPTGSPPSQLFTFNPDGTLKYSVPIQGSSQAMLGLEVIPGTTNALLVLDFGAGQVLAVDPTTGKASVCAPPRQRTKIRPERHNIRQGRQCLLLRFIPGHHLALLAEGEWFTVRRDTKASNGLGN